MKYNDFSGQKHVSRPHFLVFALTLSEQEQWNVLSMWIGTTSWEETHFFQASVWAPTTKALTDLEQNEENFPEIFFPTTSPSTLYHRILLFTQEISPEVWEMCTHSSTMFYSLFQMCQSEKCFELWRLDDVFRIIIMGHHIAFFSFSLRQYDICFYCCLFEDYFFALKLKFWSFWNILCCFYKDSCFQKWSFKTCSSC